MRKHSLLALLVLAMSSLASVSASAQVTFFSSQVAFQTTSNTTLQATFESLLNEGNINDPYTEGSVTFFNPSNLYNARPGGPAAVNDFDAPVTSNVLTVSGNEDITMTFAGSAPTAVGFTSLTNRFDAPVVSVFDVFDVLIGSYVLTQAPSTVGFVGITSTVGIGSVRWLANRGEDKDTGLDNILTGVNTIPEPATSGLMLVGLALAGIAFRRRTAAK